MAWPFRRRRDADLDEEVRAHLDRATADRVDRGEAPEAARAAARREFGNVLLVKETTREMWGWRGLERLGEDLRYGLRLLRRSPVVTAVAVLSLALGIGANTAIFSVMDALLWRPLPVAHPERLVRFGATDDPMSGIFSYPDFVKYRDRAPVFDGIAAASDLDRSGLLLDGQPAASGAGPVRITLVSGTYFQTMGAGAALGRTFTADDDRVPGGHPVAVVSDRYWKRALGGRPDVLGRALTLAGMAYAVVGVAAAPFTGDIIGEPTDVWIPIAMQSEAMPERPNLLGNPNPGWIRIVARLRPDVPRDRALAAVNTVFLSDRAPAADPRLTPLERAESESQRMTFASLASGYSPWRRDFGAPLLIVAVVVGLVLILACSNVANLLLARGAARRGEMAVRVAIGASGGRLVRQLLTESVLLAAVGGVLGAGVAWWGTRALADVIGSGLVPIDSDVRPDARVLGFTATLSMSTGLLFGLVPARHAARAGIHGVLAMSRPGGDTRGRRFGPSQTLVVAQVAVSVVLLAGAMLFVRTLQNIKGADMGFVRDRVLFAWIPVGEQGRQGAELAGLFGVAQERVSALPGVISASPSLAGLLNGEAGGSPIVIPGHTRTDDEDFFVPWNLVAPRFFATVGIPILAGRDFTAADDEHAARVAIINASMAQKYFPGRSAVGERFGMRRDTGNEIEIVGVVADAVIDSPLKKAGRLIYLPYRQDLRHLQDMCLAIKVAGPAPDVERRVRETLRAIDPTLPVRAITTADEQLDRTLVLERLVAGLSSAFGGLAAVLTCLGLYGLLSYAAARRTNEIGIRIALGAPRRQVMRMILADGVGLVVAGIALGVPAMFVVGRFVTARLVGVGPTDPATLVAASALMLVVAVLAAWIPAWRAARLNPLAALRMD